jgi:single-strand DNA-binding protein
VPNNTVTITGNATRDPELRFTPSGLAVATFGVAVNRRWQNRQTNEWDEAVSFFDVTVWAQLAENVAESVTKGTRLVVTGRLDQRSWETDAGEKRSKVEIVADEVAPSLRYATATVVKNERRGPSDEGDPGPAPPPWSQGAGAEGDEPF